MAWQARYHDAARGARVGRGDGRAVAKGAVETEVLCNQETEVLCNKLRQRCCVTGGEGCG
jgi:hypothetical protein